MQLLFLIFLASAQVLASDALCIILPVTPTESNGLAPCCYGSLTAGCVCCPNANGQTACLSPIQECVLGLGNEYICVNNPQYTSSCASEGLAYCGTGCMPSSATCCSGQTDWCPTAGLRPTAFLIPRAAPVAVVLLRLRCLPSAPQQLKPPLLLLRLRCLSSALQQPKLPLLLLWLQCLPSAPQQTKTMLLLPPRPATARVRRASLLGKGTAESAVLSQWPL